MPLTRLMRGLTESPGSVFELEADLPSGNRMFGTVGPLIGFKLACEIRFTNAPSPEDIEIANGAVCEAIGKPPTAAFASKDREASLAKVRKFMGGGQG